MQVAKILDIKGHDVHTVTPNSSIEDVVTALRDNGIGALVVSSDGKSVDGIVSERDIVHGLADRGISFLQSEVREVMTREVLTCRETDTSRTLLSHMTERRMRHVPVVDQDGLCGMISIGDAVKSRLDEIMNEANVLREYISTT